MSSSTTACGRTGSAPIGWASDPAGDAVLYEEDDPAFFVSIAKTRSRGYLLIAHRHPRHARDPSARRRRPASAPRLVRQAATAIATALDHAHGRFWILTNDRHENFRLVSAPEQAPEEAHWREEIAGDDHHYLLGVSCFAEFMVLSERSDGLADLRIRDYAGPSTSSRFPSRSTPSRLGDNREFATDRVRVGYTSMVTPAVGDRLRACGTRELVVRKDQEIPSGYDQAPLSSPAG